MGGAAWQFCRCYQGCDADDLGCKVTEPIERIVKRCVNGEYDRPAVHSGEVT